jgi:hypothetical protein
VSVGWPELLDDIERRLAQVDRELATGGPAVAPFEMPDDLGPLPPELRQRAERMLRETLTKQAAVEQARDRIVDALRQGRVAPPQPAAYFDTRI